MSYNLNPNTKIYAAEYGEKGKNGNFTIDLRNQNTPITLDFINDMAGQVVIKRKNNSLEITAYATKTKKTSQDITYNLMYKYRYYTTSNSSQRTRYTSYGRWYNDTWNSGYMAGHGIEQTYDDLHGVVVSANQAGNDNITFFVVKEYGHDLEDDPKYKYEIVWESDPYYLQTAFYDSGRSAEFDFVLNSNTPLGTFLQYNNSTDGVIVSVDKKRVLGKWTITNIDAYNGSNGVIINTQNGEYPNFDLFAAYNVVGTGKNKNNFTGTNFNEIFAGTNKADKIYTGGGSDTVDGGEGNDKIYINGKGDKTVNISQNDGNDTIYNAYKANSVTLDFDTNSLSYSKSGNNLVVSRMYGNDMEKTTLTNFFNKKPTGVNISVSGTPTITDLMKNIENGYIRLNFSNNNKTITGSAYGDRIESGKNTRTIKAGNGDNLIINNEESKYAMNISAGNGDDWYYLYDIDNKITIQDSGNKANGADYIVINDSDYVKNELFYFCNISINKKGEAVAETNMHILSNIDNMASDIKARKNKLKENIIIKNYQTKNGEKTNGTIEHVVFEDSTSYTYTELIFDYDKLKTDVVNWLNDDAHKYSSVMTALKKADANVAEELLAIYANCTTYNDIYI